MAQPSDLQNQLSSIQWTNGQRLVTGATILAILSTILGVLSGMGTWTGGVYSPNLTQAAVLGGLSFTPANKAGDTVGSYAFSSPTFALSQVAPTARIGNFAGISANGNAFSYCSIDGCVFLDGPDAGDLVAAVDHQRATGLIASVTSDDGHSQENTLGLETTIQTGWKTTWAAGASYATGANVITSQNNVYRANAACTSGSTSPTGFGNAASDGGCTWTWINTGALDAKVGFYNACRVKQGAGPSWCSSENMVIEAGPQQPGVTQKELDITNFGPKSDIGTPIIFGLNIGLGGNTITTGLQVGAAGSSSSNPGSLFGEWFTGGALAKIATIEIDSPSARSILIGGLNAITNTSAAIEDRSLGPFSYLVSGNHSTASIFDPSASPSSLQVGGTHSTADINLISTGSGAGLFLQGSYTAGQIVGKGFSIGVAGDATYPTNRLSPKTIAQLLVIACNAASEGTMAYVSDTVGSAAPTYHGAVAGGGTTAVHSPAYCNGSAWSWD